MNQAAEDTRQDIEEIDGIEFESTELSGQLVARMVEEFKAMPNVWQQLSFNKQEEVLNRCRMFAEEFVRDAVLKIAAEDRPMLQAILEQVVVKDGIKAVLTMPKNSPDRHELMDAQGRDVLIVVADAEEYVRGTGKVKGEPDQKPLLEEGEGD